MSRKSIQDDLPAFRAGHGTPMQLNLGYKGAAVTGATNNLKQWSVPAALMPDRAGKVLRLAHLNVFVDGPGTGATGGNWTFTVTNSAGTVLGTAVIAYNATVLSASVDLRTNAIGQAISAGDTLALNLTGVPTGAPTGLTSVSAEILAETYGIEA